MIQTVQVQWLGRVPYKTAWDLQKEYVQKVGKGELPNQLLLLEHPPTYTFGRKASLDNLLFSETELEKEGIDVHWVDRGGDVTYHGPGQLVGYPIINLKQYQEDWPNPIRYLRMLEQTILTFLEVLQISAWQYEGYTGVWVNHPPLDGSSTIEEPHKIAAIGAKFNGNGVSSHGFSINLHPNLHHFHGIIPCGIEEHDVTSYTHLTGIHLATETAATLYAHHFSQIFQFTQN